MQSAPALAVNGSSAPAIDGSPVVIAIDNVTKRFGGFLAVDHANFEISRGEFFSMLGPSGCGKTTMLRMIAGFESVSSGEIRLEGIDVSRVPPYRRNVNTVFQHYALFPHMTVFENVAFGPRTKGLDNAEVEKRVSHILGIVRLGDLAARRPDQLSGGQRQRVALARALVNYPSALLLDEPLSALDLKLRQAMQIELKRIQRETGITFIFVTHDQEEALTMSDRIAVMSAGRVEQVGTPQEIYHHPASVFVAGFIGIANLIGARIESLNHHKAMVEIAGGHAAAQVDAKGLSRGDLALMMIRPERIRLGAAKPDGDGWTVLQATLEEMIFQGPVVRCVLRDTRGEELVAHLGSDRGMPGFDRGSSVWAYWRTEDACLLPQPPIAGNDANGSASHLFQPAPPL